MVVETEASSMARHLGPGPAGTALERLYGAEVMEVRTSRDVSLGNFL